MIPIGFSGSPSLAQLEPCDAELLRRFWSRLSPESRYRRCMAPLSSPEGPHLTGLLEVDHVDRETIVAVVEGEIVGVGCYARRASRPDAAELAVVVADAWQRRGVATHLVSALTHRARRFAIACFEVTTLADNRAALAFLHRLSPTTQLALSHGVLCGTVPIGGGDDTQAVRSGRQAQC